MQCCVCLSVFVRWTLACVLYIAFATTQITLWGCVDSANVPPKPDKWCAEHQTVFDGCLAQPFNALSNAAYVLPLQIVLVKSLERDVVALAFGVSGLYTAVVSTWYHGTNGESISGELDVASIYIYLYIFARVTVHTRWVKTYLIADTLLFVLVAVAAHLVEFFITDRDWDLLNIVFVSVLGVLAVIVAIRLYLHQRLGLIEKVLLFVFLAGLFATLLYLRNKTCHSMHGFWHITVAVCSVVGFCVCYFDKPQQSHPHNKTIVVSAAAATAKPIPALVKVTVTD